MIPAYHHHYMSGAHLVCVWVWVMLMYSKYGCVGGLDCGIIVCVCLVAAVLLHLLRHASSFPQLLTGCLHWPCLCLSAHLGCISCHIQALYVSTCHSTTDAHTGGCVWEGVENIQDNSSAHARINSATNLLQEKKKHAIRITYVNLH